MRISTVAYPNSPTTEPDTKCWRYYVFFADDGWPYLGEKYSSFAAMLTHRLHGGCSRLRPCIEHSWTHCSARVMSHRTTLLHGTHRRRHWRHWTQSDEPVNLHNKYNKLSSSWDGRLLPRRLLLFLYHVFVYKQATIVNSQWTWEVDHCDTSHTITQLTDVVRNGGTENDGYEHEGP